ncbi:uncharacterized protein F4807DRAFT_462514 [Annulohypoxylon truncatum]|uniref:uncharacterized protein n=1 Tax=Annulohypoxylon truncatum TaxID=327061 RepID=UPI00200761D5|nr:uncharacterized protein F4807DRAFT_462514 [Annulohypoxylon truncatum]KAI1207711.1 hypothetical protein F4807DRAFT_462514 [Annulohypoxylon truncatum]
MFPDRVERIVLGGVMNSHPYYNSFVRPLSPPSTTTSESPSQLISSSPSSAISRQCTGTRNVVEYTLSTSRIYKRLVPALVLGPALADAPNDIVARGSLDRFAAFVRDGSGGNAVPRRDQAILGIQCGDKVLRTGDLATWRPDLDAYKRASRWFWDWAWGYYRTLCRARGGRSSEAKERYESDFRVRTGFSMLFVGNMWDPVMALVWARNPGDGFEHLSLTQPSNCTNGYIRDYFLEDTLPSPGPVCQANLPLFSTSS